MRFDCEASVVAGFLRILRARVFRREWHPVYPLVFDPFTPL